MSKPQPPLNALRAFEAAARTGAFTLAAQELGVSSAAISQQVKVLEAHWGKKLFLRQGNRIALTEAGLTAYPPLERAMTALGALSDMMLETQAPKSLVLSVPQSVAETWLSERLKGVDRTRLGRPIHIRIEDDPVDFAAHKIDLRIFFGHNLYGEYRVEELFQDSLIGVVSPGFAEAHGRDPATYTAAQLIHTDWGPGYSSSPDWGAVLDGAYPIDRSKGIGVSASSTALQFARQGFGAALVPACMAAMDLENATVQIVDCPAVPMAHPYKVAYPHRLARNKAVQMVVGALTGQG